MGVNRFVSFFYSCCMQLFVFFTRLLCSESSCIASAAAAFALRCNDPRRWCLFNKQSCYGFFFSNFFLFGCSTNKRSHNCWKLFLNELCRRCCGGEGNEGYRGLTNKKKPKYKCDKSEINFDVLWVIVRAEIPLHIWLTGTTLFREWFMADY